MNNKEIEKPIKSDFQEIGELFILPGDVRKVTLIKDGTLATSYRIDYDTGKRHCIAYGDDEAAFDHRICKEETSNGRPDGYFHTYWYP